MNVNFTVFIDKILSGEKRQTIRRASDKWATTKAGDRLDLYTGLGTKECRKLGEVIHGRYLNGGNATPQTQTARLNPNWVEWLMGWPIGYTDSKPLATDKFRSWWQLLLTF